MMAVCSVPIIGVMALMVDGGLLLTEHRHARSVADTAAMAAAYSLYNNYSTDQGLDPSHTARTAALNNASANGYTNDGVISVVTVNVPPLSGAFAAKAGYVEVLVQESQSKRFGAVWGAGTMSVAARTVARGIASPTSPAILLLDPSMKAAINVTGNGGITVTGGSIVVDSRHPQAGVITSSGDVSAPNINFTGSYSTSGSGGFVGTVKTAQPVTADPLAGLAVPDPALHDHPERQPIQDLVERDLHPSARRLQGRNRGQRPGPRADHPVARHLLHAGRGLLDERLDQRVGASARQRTKWPVPI